MGGLQKVTVKVPSLLWKEIKIIAAKEDRRIQDIVAEALREWLQEHKYLVEDPEKEAQMVIEEVFGQ